MFSWLFRRKRPDPPFSLTPEEWRSVVRNAFDPRNHLTRDEVLELLRSEDEGDDRANEPPERPSGL